MSKNRQRHQRGVKRRHFLFLPPWWAAIISLAFRRFHSQRRVPLSLSFRPDKRPGVFRIGRINPGESHRYAIIGKEESKPLLRWVTCGANDRFYFGFSKSSTSKDVETRAYARDTNISSNDSISCVNHREGERRGGKRYHRFDGRGRSASTGTPVHNTWRSIPHHGSPVGVVGAEVAVVGVTFYHFLKRIRGLCCPHHAPP